MHYLAGSYAKKHVDHAIVAESEVAVGGNRTSRKKQIKGSKHAHMPSKPEGERSCNMQSFERQSTVH